MEKTNGQLTKEVLQKTFEIETGKDCQSYCDSYTSWLENRCISLQNTVDLLNLQRKELKPVKQCKGDCDCGCEN
jgi:hypothetical protein